MDESSESSEVDLVAAKLDLACVDVAVAQDLVCMAECMQNGALAGAVGPEEQREGAQVDPHRPADALEVLELDDGDQR